MDSLISVIVPIYNVEQYLNRCVESITNQTYTNLEIILVDDGSLDSCSNICDDWLKKDKRIRVIHKTNSGLGKARNSGIDIATGEYILFVDSDDYVPVDSIEIMHRAIVEENSDLVAGEAYKVFSNGVIEKTIPKVSQKNTLTGKSILSMIGNNNIVHCCAWAKLYRKKLFENLRFKSLKCSEDLEIWPRIIENCEKITVIPNFVYYYYQHDSSIMHNMTFERQRDSIVAKLEVSKFLMERNLFHASHQYFRAAIINGYEMKKNKLVRTLVKECLGSKKKYKLLFGEIKTLISWSALYITVFQKTILKKCR